MSEEVNSIIEEANSALRTGSCFIAPAAAKDLIERLVKTLDKRDKKVEDVSGESLERFYAIEQLERDKAELVEALQSAKAIEDLWLPLIGNQEDEIMALHSMERMFSRLIAKHTTKGEAN